MKFYLTHFSHCKCLARLTILQIPILHPPLFNRLNLLLSSRHSAHSRLVPLLKLNISLHAERSLADSFFSRGISSCRINHRSCTFVSQYVNPGPGMTSFCFVRPHTSSHTPTRLSAPAWATDLEAVLHNAATGKCQEDWEVAVSYNVLKLRL